MSYNIVKGYNGIMDLDLNLIPSKFHKEAIDQHYKDIENYKKEQALLPKKLRYENTIVKAEKVIEIERLALQKRIKEKYDEDTRRIEEYSKRKK
jgi:hypothetical protein